MLLHGTPGGPRDWLQGGAVQDSLDNLASTHHGASPIVVMPDINGSFNADTECINGPAGDVETYLTTDVPDFMFSRFFTQPPGQRWAIAGLSEGGSCSLMLALRHPMKFSTFGDYSGLAGPRVGDSNDPAATVAALFGGSKAKFEQYEPSSLMAQHNYPTLGGWFEVGDDDGQPLAASRMLAAMARSAGIATQLVVIPGESHTFTLWRKAFADSLPWIYERISGNL
jgi:S-formylglutathione hydrolase FrmB